MRTLGLLGGMAWPSTLAAYRAINEGVAARLGPPHSARLLVYSVDFAEIEAAQRAGAWEDAGRVLAHAARALVAAGAEGLMLCTNTMHRVAESIESAVDVPFLHLADVTAAAVTADGSTRVGLLGTRFTMEEPFYRERLAAHGLDVQVPDAQDRERVHRVIYDELIHATVTPAAVETLTAVADRLVTAGAQGVVAGCTELELALTPDRVAVPLYATTALQADAAVTWLLEEDSPETRQVADERGGGAGGSRRAVVRGGVEPPTSRFSVARSTN